MLYLFWLSSSGVFHFGEITRFRNNKESHISFDENLCTFSDSNMSTDTFFKALILVCLFSFLFISHVTVNTVSVSGSCLSCPHSDCGHLFPDCVSTSECLKSMLKQFSCNWDYFPFIFIWWGRFFSLLEKRKDFKTLY